MSLFNKESDRNLWIRLNAEHQIDWEKSLKWFNPKTGKYEPTQQALNPRTMENALKVAENQLICDERRGKLRFTLEELLTLSTDELDTIYRDGIKQLFIEQKKPCK